MGLIDYVLWLGYPKQCAVCGRVIKRNEHLCKECKPLIEYTGKLCTKCGQSKKNCTCRFNVYHFEKCVGPIKKNEHSLKAIHHFKTGNNLDAANYFVENMTHCINDYYTDIHFDAVCAVPMNRFKRFTKGYNHSEVLAKRIAKQLKLQYFCALGRRKTDKLQRNLKRDERFESVKGAYYVTKNIEYKNVLLVDDVKTTGATLDECTRQLKFAGAENVYCVVGIVNQGNPCKQRKNNV